MNKKETISNLYPLKGKRIIVTAWDLEHGEHRGIANYSKNLLRSLKSLGAEVWLLTGLTSDVKFRTKYIEEKKKIEISRILGQFADSNFGITDNINFLKSTYKSSSKLLKIITLIKFIPITFFYLISGFINLKYKYYERKYFEDNPLLKTSKLDYFKDVDGLVSAKHIFQKAGISAILNTSPIKIGLKKFDVFITTCPLRLKASNHIKTIQTIHDIIPVTIPSYDDALHFYRRCVIALNTERRIYVSSFTKSEYEFLLNERLKNIKYHNKSRILIQPPSLKLEEKVAKSLANLGSIDDKNIKSLLRINKFKFKDKNLTSNQYILFNSSIEPRKNLERALETFCDYKSTHENSNFKICVIGNLQKNKYCKQLKNRFINEDIIYTGYVDEKTKLKLFLNARAFISPSLIEGFGIPVLDAASMGIKSLVSDIKPHQEIHNLKDFNKYINLISLTNYNSWLDELENIFENNESHNLSGEDKLNRIKRYFIISEQINNEFNHNIQELIK